MIKYRGCEFTIGTLEQRFRGGTGWFVNDVTIQLPDGDPFHGSKMKLATAGLSRSAEPAESIDKALDTARQAVDRLLDRREDALEEEAQTEPDMADPDALELVAEADALPPLRAGGDEESKTRFKRGRSKKAAT